MHECPRNYLRACLLLLIAESPDYGYDLAVRLAHFGLVDADAATTYRALRALERDGSVASQWRPSGCGPARRVYRLTARGKAALAECGEDLRRSQVSLTRYLRRLDAVPAARRHSAAELQAAELQTAEGGRA